MKLNMSAGQYPNAGIPFQADSQCMKLVKHLSRGRTLTALKAINMLGATEAPRRIRQVRTALHMADIGLLDRWKERGGVRFKEYYVPEWDLAELKGMLKSCR